MAADRRIMYGFTLLSFSIGTPHTNTKEYKSRLVGNPGYKYNYWSPGLHGSQLFFAEIDH